MFSKPADSPIVTSIVTRTTISLGATIEVTIGESAGLLNICLPYIVMKPILEKLSTLYLFASEEEELSEEDATIVRNKIEQAKVTVRAFVGETHISVQDFLALELGDVVQLDQHILGNLSVYVGDYLKFKAVPGLAGDRLAVQIVDVIHEAGGDVL
jgi:flagellar motor switch protein FliM